MEIKVSNMIESPVGESIAAVFERASWKTILSKQDILNLSNEYNVSIVFYMLAEENWIEFEEGFIENNDHPDPEELTIKKQLYLRLSDKAQELLSFILCPSKDFEKVVKDNGPQWVLDKIKDNLINSNSIQKLAIQCYFRHKWGKWIYKNKLEAAYSEIHSYLVKSATVCK